MHACVQGIATIKSFRREEMHSARMRSLVDGSSVMQLCNQSMNRWLALRLESVGACVSFAAAAMAIEQRGDAAWVGLTLSYALQMTSLTTMAVRTSASCLAFVCNSMALGSSRANHQFQAACGHTAVARNADKQTEAGTDACIGLFPMLTAHTPAFSLINICFLQVRLSSLAENCFNAVERVDEFSHLTPEGNPPADPSRRSSDRGDRGSGGGGASAAAQSPAGSPRPDVEQAFLPESLRGRPANEEAAGVLPPAHDPPEGFPRAGKIEFDDVQMRYRPGLPLVLKGLSFTVEPGMKVCC